MLNIASGRSDYSCASENVDNLCVLRLESWWPGALGELRVASNLTLTLALAHDDHLVLKHVPFEEPFQSLFRILWDMCRSH